MNQIAQVVPVKPLLHHADEVPGSHSGKHPQGHWSGEHPEAQDAGAAAMPAGSVSTAGLVT